MFVRSSCPFGLLLRKVVLVVPTCFSPGAGFGILPVSCHLLVLFSRISVKAKAPLPPLPPPLSRVEIGMPYSPAINSFHLPT